MNIVAKIFHIPLLCPREAMGYRCHAGNKLYKRCESCGRTTKPATKLRLHKISVSDSTALQEDTDVWT